MKSAKLVIALSAALMSVCAVHAQKTEQDRAWNQPVEPFRIAGNLYYVGANEIASYLITTPAGHIVLDGGYEETAPQIEANIRKLGFKVEDVKVLLNSQAHFDHASGFAQLKRDTAAKLEIMQGDAELIERGGRGDFFFGDQHPFPPAHVDRVLHDSDTVSLGGTTMKAVLTAGHTRGCTTWTMDVNDGGRTLHAVSVCSQSVLPGSNLINNPGYPNQAQDYRDGFRKLRALPCDIFLGAHGGFFNLETKRAKLKSNPKENPFIDAQGYRDYVNSTEKTFEAELAKQTSRK
jgi:metallo-beta-lactamase class B